MNGTLHLIYTSINKGENKSNKQPSLLVIICFPTTGLHVSNTIQVPTIPLKDQRKKKKKLTINESLQLSTQPCIRTLNDRQAHYYKMGVGLTTICLRGCGTSPPPACFTNSAGVRKLPWQTHTILTSSPFLYL